MNISEIMNKMIAYSDGNLRDINHLIQVWTYARMIGELEKLEPEMQFILEVAAITHDIACPLCREKYGNANGKLQEQEGKALVRDFLKDTGLSETQTDRVSYLVGHHHTLEGIKGADYQILVEADYIVNAGEGGYSRENIRDFGEKIFRTPSGTALLHSIFLADNG